VHAEALKANRYLAQFAPPGGSQAVHVPHPEASEAHVEAAP
jgi:hypothetical protein